MSKKSQPSVDPSNPYMQLHASRPRMTFGSGPSPTFGLAFLRDTIPLTTFLGFGALLQYLITTFAAPHYTWSIWVLPLALVLGPWIRPTLQHYGVMTDATIKRILPGTWTPRMPGGVEDASGRLQSPEFVIFMIGARFHGAFGRFSARARRTGKQFEGMWKELQDDPDSGLINVDTFFGTSEFTNNKLRTIAVFRSKEDLWRFAHGPTHSAVWKEYYSYGEEANKMYEIWHEMFVVKEGGYEGIFGNFDPKGSTMANIFRKVSEIDPEHARAEEGDMWKSILEPINGVAKTAAGRMGAPEFVKK